jgi:N-acetylmuramoyl-L-alanine amidase
MFPSGRSSRWLLLLAASGLLLLPIVLHLAAVHAQTAGQSQLTVYSPQTTYSVPVLEMGGQPYVGLVELFEPLGSVEARADRSKYKFRFTTPGGRPQEAQFTQGKDKGKLRGRNYKLPANFVLKNGRGYVPLAALNDLLYGFTSQDIEFHFAARRLFIGKVAQRFTLDFRQENPPRLVIAFTAPVNPSIATEPGRVRLTFRRDPVIAMGADKVSYTDPLITGASFSEHDGMAELDVLGPGPLMANFADGGKTIIIAPVPPPPPVAQQEAPPAAPTALPEPSTAPAQSTPRFLVLIDPAHGGSDTGAAITPALAEKDVVLALARRVQRALTDRGIAASMLRSTDITISLDQRALSVNAARPALYLALHAANTGRGVHVFTSLLPAVNASPRAFLPWETAQAAFLDLSASVAGSVAAELEAAKLPNATLVAPLRPMNNVAAPALAIEIAPPNGNVNEIASAAYQQQVAQSVAAGIAAVRGKLPEVRP